jgi:hypothetical protein
LGTPGGRRAYVQGGPLQAAPLRKAGSARVRNDLVPDRSQMSTQAQQDRSEPQVHPLPKSGIVWIASFPKSGNTWARTFLHNLARIRSGEAGEQDINQMSRFSTWDLDKRIYAKYLGFEPDNEKHRKEIAAIRHRVHQHIADSADGLVFVKTHNAMLMDRGHSAINFAVTAGAVYVVRNPLDVAISYGHHMGKPVDIAIEMMAMPDMETDGSDRATYEVYGSWSRHVWSWTRTPHRAVLVMRYEDMLADPTRTFGGLARHLLLDPTPDQLREATELPSFERLQAQERERGFRERPEGSDGNFFREGRAGQWKEWLTQAQVDRIVRDHGEQMRRFGYLPLS